MTANDFPSMNHGTESGTKSNTWMKNESITWNHMVISMAFRVSRDVHSFVSQSAAANTLVGAPQDQSEGRVLPRLPHTRMRSGQVKSLARFLYRRTKSTFAWTTYSTKNQTV